MLVVCWAAFAVLWRRAVVPSLDVTLGWLAGFIAAVITVAVVTTAAWVAHNLGIHRRKGPRRSIPVVEERFTHDFLDRRLDADWDAARAARCVAVQIADDRKHFLPGGQVPARPARLG